MGLEDQGLIKETVERIGAENLVVILGTGDAKTAQVYAQTVTDGDPTFSGPLTGIALKVPVYFIAEDSIKRQIPVVVYEEHIAILEMALPVEEINSVVQRVRGVS